jgi:DNA-binding beta-propeller fold protein YncE
VTNYKDSTVSAINAAQCNATQISGCKARPPAITVAGGPAWTVVNPALHTVYIVAQDANDVLVLSAK